MKLITLSDHSADQQNLEREARERRYVSEREDWLKQVEARQSAIDLHKGDFIRAARHGRPWAAIGALLKWIGAATSSKPAPPVIQAASDQERRWASGQTGEQRVRSCLGSFLGDEWAAVAGYRNRGGEMDLLVVGPSALVAIEVKYLNGVVHCTGQTWTRDKYDRYGNLVEQGVPVQDKKGRAPSRQVNEAADALEAFLVSRGQRVKVQRAVVLAHDASRLGVIKESSLDFIGAVASTDFAERLKGFLFAKSGVRSEGMNVDLIVDLVRKDHAYHARRLADRGSPVESKPVATRASHEGTPKRGELLPQRIVAPMGAIGSPMSALALRQMDSLIADLRLLAASGGADAALGDRVRRAVAGHLMNGARWTVLSACDGTLGPGPERDHLRLAIRACRQRFDFDDRTLHAIVAPVAVQLQSEVHAGQGIDEGAAELLSLPALMVTRMLGAEKVAFGSRIYAGKDLFYADARKIRELLLRIEIGDPPPEATISSRLVRAAADPDWDVVYFLGVAVTAPGKGLAIDDEGVQRQLMSVRPQLAGALTSLGRVAFNRDVGARAVSEGVWSLDAGVHHGEDLRRRHALERMLARFGKASTGIELWFAEDRADNCVRLLIGVPGRACEFSWDLLVGEPTESFRRCLTAAAAIHLPLIETKRGREVDLYALQLKAKELGLSWLGRAMSPQRPPGRT